MTIEERKDRLMHIILNCGNDEALLSQLEDTVVAESKWGQLIREDVDEKRVEKYDRSSEEGLVREDVSLYGGSDLTAKQWDGLREAQEEAREGKVIPHEEVMKGLFQKVGLEWSESE